MKLYKQEQALANKFSNVVSFNATMAVVDECKPELLCATAEAESARDLYPVISILASTNWNANDHIFLAEELYKARNTPNDHPINIGHNENKIVGHLKKSWCMTEFLDIIEDSLPFDQWPAFFHLVVAGVVYTAWREEDNMDDIKELIESIKSGEMAVSMECMFPRFDYMLRKDGQDVLVERTEDTAFLTKHLVQFGGSGMFDGHRIGMVIRDLFFTGKGFTTNPANEESQIIAAGSEKINLNKDLGVTISTVAHILEKNKMSLELELEQNKAALAELQNAKVELENAKAELAKQLEDSAVTVASLNTAIAEKDAEITRIQESLNAAAAELVEAKASITSLSEEIATLKADRELFERRVSLQMNGAPLEEATAAVELYKNLSKEQWNHVADLLVKPKNVPATASKTPAEGTLEVEPVVPAVQIPTSASVPNETELEQLQKALASILN